MLCIVPAHIPSLYTVHTTPPALLNYKADKNYHSSFFRVYNQRPLSVLATLPLSATNCYASPTPIRKKKDFVNCHRLPRVIESPHRLANEALQESIFRHAPLLPIVPVGSYTAELTHARAVVYSFVSTAPLARVTKHKMEVELPFYA